MTSRTVFVHLDRPEGTVPIGRLWSRLRKGLESASFEYDESWLSEPERFALEPALSLGAGPFHTRPGRRIFGAFGDSAPDRWGRTLMQAAERRRARTEGRAARALREIDYLLGVNDFARQGALRFAEEAGGPFLAEPGPEVIPPLVELPRLLAAAEAIADAAETWEDLQILLAPGSSLGGARPKASVRDRNGRLAIAKFSHKEDPFGVIPWESVALRLARQAGIRVPPFRVESIDRKPVLIVERFDRSGRNRIPFLSAMSMLDAEDGDTRTYLEIADAVRMYGAAPKEDLSALWRRLTFNILISNTDDHLRNHGFLYEGAGGWRLSPAYDLNPVPADVKPRILSTPIQDADPAASFEAALETADAFELTEPEARRIGLEAGEAVSGWRGAAREAGIPRAEIERMASAFEHEDLRLARTTRRT